MALVYRRRDEKQLCILLISCLTEVQQPVPAEVEPEQLPLAGENTWTYLDSLPGRNMTEDDLKQEIKKLAENYSSTLNEKIEDRKEEMKGDDNSHYLIYKVLGITYEDGQLIDIYQNTGRFLYKYAGSFLEEAATLCFKYKFPEGKKTKIENTRGQRPKSFEIDFLNQHDAIEVKWKDATTDGDHVTKEHARVRAISDRGYKPIRVMFYYPQRTQAIRIQETLKTLYAGVRGEYYGGEEAWAFLERYTGVDLKAILIEIADEREPSVSVELTASVAELEKDNAAENGVE